MPVQNSCCTSGSPVLPVHETYLTQMSTIQKPVFDLAVLTAFRNSREPILRCSSSHLQFKPDEIKCVLLLSVAYEQFR